MRTLLTMLLFVSSTAFADFSGSWAGTGKLAADSGQQELAMLDCSNVAADIAQTSDTLTINALSYSCASDEYNADISYIPSTYQISGTDLMANGVVVGSITDTKITIVVEDTANDYRNTLAFEMTDAGMTFSDHDDNPSTGKVIWDLNSALALPTP